VTTALARTHLLKPQPLPKRPSRRVIVAWALAGLLALTVLVVGYRAGQGPTALPTQVPGVPAEPGPRLSGLPWASGIFTGSETRTQVESFEKWRGSAADVATLFTERSSWDGLVSPAWPVDEWAGWPGRLSIAEPLFPAGGNLRACASGTYDKKWKRLGGFLTSRDRADSYIRLGWEFNGDWFYWATQNVRDFKTCFSRVATAIKSGAPSVSIVWNPTGAESKVTDNPMKTAYPGDDYVDVIGVDWYDMFQSRASTDEEWQQAVTRNGQGLFDYVAFTRQHGKKFAVPEWGVVSEPSTKGGGDNPYYVQKMHELFATNIDVMEYEAYFSSSDAGNVESDLGGSRNKRAAATYQSLW
jgi:Glycosyl hydrolase family 26